MIFNINLYEHKYVQQRDFKIQTLGGIAEAHVEDEAANLIKINMGKITFLSTEIPVKGNAREVVGEELEVDSSIYKVTCLSIGNPHCVIPMDEINEEKARELGPSIENHDMFPNRINMQLLKVIDKGNIEIQIWERGAGYTLASGSSSCAAVGAANKLGLVDNKVNVKMPGGNLLVEISDPAPETVQGEPTQEHKERGGKVERDQASMGQHIGVEHAERQGYQAGGVPEKLPGPAVDHRPQDQHQEHRRQTG